MGTCAPGASTRPAARRARSARSPREADVASYTYRASRWLRLTSANRKPTAIQAERAHPWRWRPRFPRYRSARPWRIAYRDEAAGTMLMSEGGAGRYDVDVVHALLAPRRGRLRRSSVAPFRRRQPAQRTRARDPAMDQLGASNKVVAQNLGISPSTVRTHIESVFRKWESTTRAAATLKATHLGLL